MDTDVRSLPPGASVWETDLYEMLTEHAASERTLLEEYIEIAQSAGSKALTYIVELLIADEKRHHRIWLDLAESLRVDAELMDAPTVVPSPDFNAANTDRVIEITDRLLASERADLQHLKRVQKMLAPVEHATLWGLLVEMMQHDTDKHIAILRHAHRLAKDAKRR